jgi:NAD(P)-dependent dehydrogenase (short-subunit alcohol dehydrogenase family)
MKLERGQVAVVTGGASGIGFAMARRFAADGLAVVIADVERAALDRAVAELASSGAEAYGRVTDVRDPEAMEALALEVWKRNGRVDVLCNNAGVATLGRIADQTLADWEWVLGVNFWGVLHGIRAFLPKLQTAGRPAHIVNTASLAGLVDGPMLAPYFVSKHAVVSLSECLYLELQAESSPIGVSVLCPGFVRTSIMDSSRNRSGGPSEAEQLQRSGASQLDQLMRFGITTGMDPSEVADKVFSAVCHGRFWVLPHDGSGERVRSVAARSYGDQNPELTPIAQQAGIAEPGPSPVGAGVATRSGQ